MLRPNIKNYYQYLQDDQIVMLRLPSESPKGFEKPWHIRLEKVIVDVLTDIAMRARQANIITKDTYETTMKWMSKNGLRADEHSNIIPEKTHLLGQLISRAVSEDEIGISKAAELLELPLTDARRLCYGGV